MHHSAIVRRQKPEPIGGHRNIIINKGGVILYHLYNWKRNNPTKTRMAEIETNSYQIMGSSSPYFVSRGSPDPQTQQDMSRYLWTWHITCCFTYLFYFYLISSVWYQHQELVGTHIEARTVAFRNCQSFSILAISQLKSIKTPIKTS